MRAWWVASSVALILLLAPSALGQATTPQPPSDENLSNKVINPIAFLTRVKVENKYSPSLWDSAGVENQAEGVFVVPFNAFARQNLARIKIIFETSKPDGSHGLSQSEIFDLLLFQRRWGTLGAGFTAHLTAQS